MDIITFEQFQRERKFMRTAEYQVRYNVKLPHDPGPSSVFAYRSGLYIEVFTDGFQLTFDNKSHVSSDLTELEKELYNYADGLYFASSEEMMRKIGDRRFADSIKRIMSNIEDARENVLLLREESVSDLFQEKLGGALDELHIARKLLNEIVNQIAGK